MRRYVRILISPELLANMLSGAFQVVASALPADARIVSRFYDPPRDAFTIVVEHESFAPTEAGQEIPIVRGPQITRLPGVEKLEAIASRAAMLASAPWNYGRGQIRTEDEKTIAAWAFLREALTDAGYDLELLT